MDSSAFGVAPICASKNELEIRLKWFSRGESGIIILTYNDESWEIKKYKQSQAGFGNKIEVITFKSKGNFELPAKFTYIPIFDSIRNDGIFLLPNQKQLKYEETIRDGVSYKLTYKVGNKFRDYTFWNTKSYAELYKGIDEFKQYTKIIERLFSVF